VFTGIVEVRRPVREVRTTEHGVRLAVVRDGWTPAGGTALGPGDSVCVSGVCLTLASVDASALAFDVVAETLRRTTLGELRPGDPVNLEPSLTPTSFLGGHFVQGHVDGVGTVTAVRRDAVDRLLTVRPPSELMRYTVPKGSIAIDGVSLTIAAAGETDFTVALVPTTLERTTLGTVEVGTRVNLETDILARTIAHYLERTRAGR
jgi:riboflavin synthase